MKPLFIISMPRSGSTLLQRILASHQDIATESEPWILLPLVSTLDGKGVFAEYDQNNTNDAISYFLKDIKSEYKEELGRFVEKIYALKSNNERYFLDKTPRYFLIFDELVEMFPNAKFIILNRHPLDVFSSILGTWHKNRLRFENSLLDLYEGPHAIASGIRKHKHALSISYEELVNNPSKTLGAIGQYLDLEFNMDDLKIEDNLKGPLGDKVGTKSWDHINLRNTNKWKNQFDNLYRRRLASKYVKSIGADNFETLGYNYLATQEALKGGVISIRILLDLFDSFIRFLIVKTDLAFFVKRKKRSLGTSRSYPYL